MASPWALFLLMGAGAAQQIGTLIPEVHPKLMTQTCTTGGGCKWQNTQLTLDQKYRDFHYINDVNVSCWTLPLNATICPDAATCSRNCVLEGADYQANGVQTRGSALTLKQWLWNGTAYDKVSPRVYLLEQDGKNYVNLTLLGKEFSFDVDMSGLSCGMNAAVYTGEMPMSGGRSDLNPGGAAYGHAYCDAQCYKKPWWNGQPNLNSSGACCAEMDFWEANSMATVYTPHACSGVGNFACNGTDCDGQVCDKGGCGLNPYWFGAKDYYGPGKTVDTTRPFTVVTQFRTASGTQTLNEIRQFYVQDGAVIDEPKLTTVNNPTGTITGDFCTARNASDFNRLGGLENFGKSLGRGHVLIFSLWNSPDDFMNWLDSSKANETGPPRGPCNTTEGDPKIIMQKTPNVEVTFSNIRWGDMNSTFNASASPGGSRSAAVRFTASDANFGPGRLAFLSASVTTLLGAMMFAWL